MNWRRSLRVEKEKKIINWGYGEVFDLYVDFLFWLFTTTAAA